MIKLNFKNKAQSDRNSWVLTHARGNLSARDAVEGDEYPNSCEDDTSSESSDSDDSSNDSSTYVVESFEVMFVPEEEIQQRGSLNIIIMWRGVEINFWLMRGGYDLVLGHMSPFPCPPLPGNYYAVPKDSVIFLLNNGFDSIHVNQNTNKQK